MKESQKIVEVPEEGDEVEGKEPEPEAVVEQLETRNVGAATEQPTAKTSRGTRKRLESATTLERTGAQRLTR